MAVLLISCLSSLAKASGSRFINSKRQTAWLDLASSCCGLGSNIDLSGESTTDCKSCASDDWAKRWAEVLRKDAKETSFEVTARCRSTAALNDVCLEPDEVVIHVFSVKNGLNHALSIAIRVTLSSIIWFVRVKRTLIRWLWFMLDLNSHSNELFSFRFERTMSVNISWRQMTLKDLLQSISSLITIESQMTLVCFSTNASFQPNQVNASSSFRYFKRNAVTKWFYLNIPETVRASDFKICRKVALNSLYFSTGNDVINYFLSAANRTNVLTFGHVRVAISR